MSLFDFTQDASDPNNPNATLATPDQIARRQQMAAELMKQGSDYSPVQSPWQGLARMANAALGGYMNYKEGQNAQDANKASGDALTAAMLGLKGGAPAASSASPMNLAPAASSASAGSSPATAPSNLLPYFAQASQATGIPVGVLVAQAKQESNLNPNAVGKAGEVGLTQIMPSTARSPGFGVQGVDPASLRDPAANIMFGAQYLAGRGKAAGVQDWNDPAQVAKALRAYNGGGDPNYVANVMRFMPKTNAQADLPAPGAVNAGGAPLPPGAAAFGAGGAPQADAGLSSAMFDPNKMGGGATDYTLGSRGLNSNNNGAGMTEIAPGSVGQMSARTTRQLGGNAPEATTPADLQMVARLLRGDPAPADVPAPSAVAPGVPAAVAATPAPAPPAPASPPPPPPSPDVPAPRAVNAGPAPVPSTAPQAAPAPGVASGAMAADDTFKQILAGTAYRAANPHPGDQQIPLSQLQPGSAAYPNMEGSPEAAQAQQASQAKAAQAGQAVQLQQLMGVIQNPYTSPAQRQVATLLLQKYMGQEQWKDATGPNGMVGQRNTVTGEFKPLAEQADQKWGVIGEDAMGRKQYGRPPAPGTQPAPPAVAPGANPDVMNLHGEDFIKTLDPGIQTQVKAIVEGRAPYPTGMLLKTPYGQQLAQFVTQADPSFDTANATSRTKVRNEFNAGGPSSPAGAITAGNTAIQHLGHLSDAAESLGNSDSSFPGAAKTYNVVKNALSSGKAAVPLTEFNNIVGKYVEEATKFYRGTGGTEADIQRDLSHLNPNMTPSELHAAIKTQAELLQSKINALQDRWKQGMGPLVPDFPIVHPESAKQMETIRKRAGGEAPKAGQEANPAKDSAPAMPKSEAEYKALPSGALWVDPDTGETKRKK